MGITWKEYASYQIERKRPKTAQKIYLRALVGVSDADGGNSNNTSGHGAVTSEDDRKVLWEDFLDMMRNIKKDSSLTMEQLREAVDTEHTVKVREERIQAEIDAISDQQQQQQQPPAKRQKGLDIIGTQQQVITAEAVDMVASALIETTKNISPALNAEWLARDGNAMPTRPDPPLFSPSPPKLGDPSGKDLLGTELALKLIRLLLNKSDAASGNGTGNLSEITGGTVLDIVNGCWMMTALKEKEAATSQSALDKKLVSTFVLSFLIYCFSSYYDDYLHCLFVLVTILV